MLAELCKGEEARNTLGTDTPLVDVCLDLIGAGDAGDLPHHMHARSDPPLADTWVQFHGLRVLGNLCYNHAGHRARILQHSNGLPAIIAALQALVSAPNDAEHVRFRIVAAGVLVNVSDDSEPMQSGLVALGAIPQLAAILAGAPSASHPHYTAARHALDLFLSAKEAVPQMAAAGVVPVLLRALRALAQPGEDDDLQACEDELNNTVALTRELIHDDRALPAFATPDNALLLLSLARGDALAASAIAALFLSVLVNNVDVQHTLDAHGFQDVWRAWLTDPSPELRTAAGICVGNMAHDDASAVAVLSAPCVLPALKDMLRDDDSKCVHAALGAIKNLSVAAANKPVMIAAGVVPLLLPGLQSPHAPIQYLGASLVRSLCLQQQPSTVALVASAPELLSRLAHLSRSEDLPVRAEATRALGNVIKGAKSAGVAADIVQLGGVSSLLSLLAMPEQPVLQSDALIALLYLVTLDGEHVARLVAAGALPLVTAVVGRTDLPVEIRCNAMSLCRALLSDPGTRGTPDARAALDAVHAVEPSSDVVAQLVASFSDLLVE